MCALCSDQDTATGLPLASEIRGLGQKAKPPVGLSPKQAGSLRHYQLRSVRTGRGASPYVWAHLRPAAASCPSSHGSHSQRVSHDSVTVHQTCAGMVLPAKGQHGGTSWLQVAALLLFFPRSWSLHQGQVEEVRMCAGGHVL